MDYTLETMKALLDEKVERYNHIDFIDTDPIQIPHQFSKKEDIEIAGFLAATIAWGQRKSIIRNGQKLMELMEQAPYDFIMDTDFDQERNTHAFRTFTHRTFNGDDCIFFLRALQQVYTQHGGLENVFTEGYLKGHNSFHALIHFRNIFLETTHPERVKKHLSDVRSNSAAKRLNMFLRWMVRNNSTEVDFGLWKQIPSSALMLPLDVHTGDVARAYGLLQRKQNDWKAVEEITAILRSFDPTDPVKYDFALFGIGAFENKKALTPERW